MREEVTLDEGRLHTHSRSQMHKTHRKDHKKSALVHLWKEQGSSGVDQGPPLFFLFLGFLI